MKGQCKDRKESLFGWERVSGCCFQGRGVASTTESYRDPRKVDYAKLQNGASEGGTRIWTGDLLICSQMLYPWATPPAVIWQSQLTPLCCCSYIWTLPTSAAPAMGSNTHGHSRLVLLLWNPTGLPLQVGGKIDSVTVFSPHPEVQRWRTSHPEAQSLRPTDPEAQRLRHSRVTRRKRRWLGTLPHCQTRVRARPALFVLLYLPFALRSRPPSPLLRCLSFLFPPPSKPLRALLS